MKTFTALLLIASLAGAAEPDDTPTLAPDVPNVSVRLRAGETAPFDGRLLSLDENLRRGKDAVDCKADLAEAKTNTWVPKPVLVGVIVGALVLGAAGGAAVVWAAKR